MTKAELGKWMQRTFEECQKLREQGQAEYARKDENCFANFERTAEYLKLDRERILMVFLMKHMDGIAAYVNGHVSQRENIRGRIGDAITYLCLLRGMIEQKESNEQVAESAGTTLRETNSPEYCAEGECKNTAEADVLEMFV